MGITIIVRKVTFLHLPDLQFVVSQIYGAQLFGTLDLIELGTGI